MLVYLIPIDEQGRKVRFCDEGEAIDMIQQPGFHVLPNSWAALDGNFVEPLRGAQDDAYTRSRDERFYKRYGRILRNTPGRQPLQPFKGIAKILRASFDTATELLYYRARRLPLE